MLSTPALRSIFREQVFEVVFGETLSEALLAEDVRDGLGFALLQFPNLFFHRARGNEAISVNCSRLADAVVESGLILREMLEPFLARFLWPSKCTPGNRGGNEQGPAQQLASAAGLY